MFQGYFELSDNSSIEIKGTSFDLNSLKNLNDILQKLNHENKVKKTINDVILFTMFIHYLLNNVFEG